MMPEVPAVVELVGVAVFKGAIGSAPAESQRATLNVDASETRAVAEAMVAVGSPHSRSLKLFTLAEPRRAGRRDESIPEAIKGASVCARSTSIVQIAKSRYNSSKKGRARYKSVRRSGVSSFASSFGRSRLFRPCGLPAALRPCCAPALHLRFFGVSVTVSKYVRESVSAESDRCRSSSSVQICRTVCVPAPPVSFSGSKVRFSCSGLLDLVVHVKHLELSPVNRGWLWPVQLWL